MTRGDTHHPSLNRTAAVFTVEVIFFPFLMPGTEVFGISTAFFAWREKLDFELKYTAVIKDIPEGVQKMRVWIPYPQEDVFQRIYSIKIDAPYHTCIHTENTYGNQFVFIEVDNPDQGEIIFPQNFPMINPGIQPENQK